MGTRLYPNTTVPAKLEVLAGVPAGTHGKLVALEAEFALHAAGDFHDRMQREEAFYAALYEAGNADVNRLHGFLGSGWGKFSLPEVLKAAHTDAQGYLHCSGSLDGDDAALLLAYNGIDADVQFCEGLHYC